MVEKKKARGVQAEIRSVFMEHWDPIGINDQPACWDEYDSYIGGAIKLLLENGSDGELAEYLRRIVRERMELSPDEGAIGNTINALRRIQLT